jgi:uncharacterized protein YceK
VSDTLLRMVLLTVLVLPGCVSFLARNVGRGLPDVTPIYPGLNVVVHAIGDAHEEEPPWIVLGGLFFLVDFPFSFTLDTLILPYDLVMWGAGKTQWPTGPKDYHPRTDEGRKQPR